MNFRTHVIALSVSLCWTQLLFSQVDQASLTGSVTDQSGAIVSGATIKTLAKESGQEREVTTNSAGVYTIPNLTLGTYTVTVEKPGFATQSFRCGMQSRLCSCPKCPNAISHHADQHGGNRHRAGAESSVCGRIRGHRFHPDRQSPGQRSQLGQPSRPRSASYR